MIKKLRFWGTSAGEGIPDPFCDCRICQNAREKGGRELRLRSSFRIDEENMIDIGADFVGAAQKLGESLSGVKNVLFTHTHDDHFNYSLFWTRSVAKKPLDFPLNVYLTDSAYRVIDELLMNSPLTYGREHFINPKNVNFLKLEFHGEYDIGGLRVIPLRGNHRTCFEKNSANYLITLPNGKTMYYALDTGYYLEETFEALKGKKIDLLINECTYPIIEDDGKNTREHSSLHSALRCFERLYSQGTISEKTEIWLSHIGTSGATHAELSEYLSEIGTPYRVSAAYDGLSLEDRFGW